MCVLVSVAEAQDKSDVIGALDEVEERLDRLEDNQKVAEQSGGSSVGHRDGFGWQSSDGRNALSIGGMVRSLVDVGLISGDVERAGLVLGNAQIVLGGRVYSDFYFRVLAELSTGDGPLLDYLVDYRFDRELILRAGQMKVPFARSNLARVEEQIFPAPGGATDAILYDRDIGVVLHGRVGKLQYMAGVFNGGGQNALNDNVDFMEVARVELGLIGDPIGSFFENDYRLGDVFRVSEPHVTVGAGASHDLVAVPAKIAGIEVGQQDVDGSGVPDNVRVLSASADILFRYRGFELLGETILRQERWGTILNHTENQGVLNQVGTNDAGVRNYGVIIGHVAYFIVPETLLIGARGSIGAVPLLSLGGRQIHDEIPGGDRRFDLDTTATWYGDDRGRSLGLSYRFSHFSGALEMNAPAEHTITLEGLFRL